MSNTYLAITIGPIYDTFSQARRTRAIWAASYFFSFFMRKILEKAFEQNWEIMLPHNKKIFKGKHGAGLYADRLYFVNKTKSELTEIINQVIEFFAEDFKKQDLCNKDSAEPFLRNYLNIHIVEISLSDDELNKIKSEKDKEGKSNNSVLRILNNLLDNQELKKNYVFDFENNYIIDYFTKKWKENTVLKIDAFGDGNDRVFKSLGEIATNDLFLKNPKEYKKLLRDDFKNEDIELIDELKKSFKDSFRDYHKYYAVFYADGDNIGDLLNSVANDRDKLQTFSEKLLEFGVKAEETIQTYGGSAIYLGGEDIFAILPIAFNHNNQLFTLAHLIDNLDKDFNETLGKYASEQNVTVPPTLSYGLMLAYYKFPMREAMNEAHELLEKCKKDFKETGKNAIGVRFQKHSGQYMECFIQKNKKQSTKLIYKLLTQHLQIRDKKDTLSGLIQRLKDDVFFTTFMLALRKGRIDAFFKNFFNEDIHSEKKDFIDFFAEMVNALSSEYLTTTTNESDIEKENDTLKNIIFTVLRYYQFIQPKKIKKDE